MRNEIVELGSKNQQNGAYKKHSSFLVFVWQFNGANKSAEKTYLFSPIN